MTRLAAPLALLLTLAACGKINGPTPPGPPEDITYPKTYPTH